LLIQKGGGYWPCETLATLSLKEGANSCSLAEIDKPDVCLSLPAYRQGFFVSGSFLHFKGKVIKT
jgi:hypothetical protein